MIDLPLSQPSHIYTRPDLAQSTSHLRTWDLKEDIGMTEVLVKHDDSQDLEINNTEAEKKLCARGIHF